MKTPRGFSYAGLNAGIKASRKDMALVASEVPCAAAGCFTVNASRAAPVRHAQARLPAAEISAIVVNSGNANALTGPEGDRDVEAVCAAVATALGVPSSAVLSASTGVIGVRLPTKKLVDAAVPLAAARGEAIELAAEAILTTDTRVKLASRSLVLGGKSVTLAAFAKGSGMIAPELATMLAFLTTDARIAPSALQKALGDAMGESFGMLTVDGDMSTNDAVFLLANGLADNGELNEASADYPLFAAAVASVCVELARAIAEDGEGATKLLEITVSGAPTVAIARDLARSVAGSSLVKAAMFGSDPNWGRILSTIGARVGSNRWPIDPTKATVTIQGTRVFEGGAPAGADPSALRAKMREPQVLVDVVLAEGAARAVAWGCDLSYDYVKINADYTSLTTSSPEGVVSRDDRLTNYSPGFKRALLVEALSYIARFTSTRAVIKYGGAAMVKDSLKASFANDVNLLRSAGLLPIVVHGGGPEITKVLEKLGKKTSEFVDGVRVTDADDVKVVEMVLTGKISTEIVSLLNRDSAHAIGVSGKDGGLLRAKKLASENGRDLGRVGEITHVNRELLEMLLDKRYVPVISPVALGEDGAGYNINADAAAAEIAVALGAGKLIYLTDVAGILDANGDLISEITAAEIAAKIADGTIKGGMVAKVKSVLRAIAGGVTSVHIIDGRTPHSVIAELFTDHGVGTLVRALAGDQQRLSRPCSSEPRSGCRGNTRRARSSRAGSGCARRATSRPSAPLSTACSSSRRSTSTRRRFRPCCGRRTGSRTAGSRSPARGSRASCPWNRRDLRDRNCRARRHGRTPSGTGASLRLRTRTSTRSRCRDAFRGSRRAVARASTRCRRRAARSRVWRTRICRCRSACACACRCRRSARTSRSASAGTAECRDRAISSSPGERRCSDRRGRRPSRADRLRGAPHDGAPPESRSTLRSPRRRRSRTTPPAASRETVRSSSAGAPRGDAG